MKKTEKSLFFSTLSYRLFGRIASHFAFLRPVYMQSGLCRSYESYVALMFFASSISFVLTFTVAGLVHYFLLQLTLLGLLAAVLVFSSIVALVIPLLFVAYPLYRSSQRRKEIDANLVYTTGYMGVLSAGGISIERIFDRVTQVEQHAPIRDLASRLIANVRVLGLDIASSINDVMLHSSSEIFSKLLVGIMNTLRTSADLKSLFSFETQRLLHAKREQLKKTLNSLMSFGEIYITGVVISPIVFIVMITILSVMGNVAFGLSPVMQLNLLVFFGIPVISAVSIVILNGILPEEG
jgi:archaellum biogenesis protein FlaJ (TadC family)